MAPERSRPRRTDHRPSERDGRRTTPEQEYESHTAIQNERTDREAPDVVLDVPKLNIEELNLEVDDLKAHISARAELADLVRVNVGVDVFLGKVKLGIKGVEAQALLEVKLGRILDTLDRALDAINRNPQILTGILEDAGRAPEGAGGAAAGVESAAEQAARTTEREVAAGPGDRAGGVAELGIEEEYVDEQGRLVGRARDEAGNVVEEVLDEGGNALERVPADAAEPDETAESAEATDAARRKAEELGMDLSSVEGTGSGGRILVRDVEKAAKG